MGKSNSVRNINHFIFRKAFFSFKIIALLILFSSYQLTCIKGYAQETDMTSVTGVITDKSGEPVLGATLLVKGTTKGTTTDFDGKYVLSGISNSSVLVVSYLGMKTKEITVKGQKTINIVLEDETIGIEEVVVVGYGTQKKVNLTGAVSAVKVDDKLSSRSLPSASLALQGKVPGLSITQNSGMAGRNDVQMLVRGMGTVNNANPLVVVDGMPDVDINRLNMDDIESISVLKDAASSAIYGSRAANGVILITTKSGKESESRINASASYTIGKPTHSWEFMADYPRALTLHQRDAAVGTLPENFIFKNGTIDQY